MRIPHFKTSSPARKQTKDEAHSKCEQDCSRWVLSGIGFKNVEFVFASCQAAWTADRARSTAALAISFTSVGASFAFFDNSSGLVASSIHLSF